MRPRRSASTCAAVVGETWPERLADGATTGWPNRQDGPGDRVIGIRSAMVGSPAVASSATPHSGSLGNTRVRGPARGVRQPRRLSIEAPEPGGRGAVLDMGDQRIERRPALGLVEPRHRPPLRASAPSP